MTTMYKFRDVIFLLAYSGLIYWLSDQQSLPAPLLFQYQDKLHHVAAYAVMGWLSWRCFSHFFNRQSPLLAAAFVYCIVFALTDEWHQSFVPGRSADIFDWVADAIGAGLVVAWLNKSKLVRSF